ncbi:MAG: OFA family MFS transporter [Methanomicrobiales archaeon]|nr:OFA family MFS transporter [Methanomicrobiales archaeon]
MEPVKILGMKAESGRWVLVLCGLTINLCLGTIYAWSVFKGPLQNYFTTTLGQQVTPLAMSLPFSVFLAMFAIAMPFTGKYIESLGPMKVAMIGGILTGLGWLLASVATAPWHLTLMYGVIGGLGVGIAYGVPVAVSTRWFPDRKGLAVGLTLLGFGLSALLTADLAKWFIAQQGVISTLQIFGISFIVIMILLSLPLCFPPSGWKPEGWNPPARKPGEALACECNRSEMLRSTSFYALWICYFIGCLAGLMAIGIVTDMAKQLQVATIFFLAPAGFFAIFNGGGRPLFGALTDRLNPRNTAVLSFVLIALASLMLWVSPTAGVFILAFAILYLCFGGWLAIAPTATASYFGTCDYPRCYGVVFLAYGAGALVGPTLASSIQTASGSLLGVFPYVLGLSLIGGAIAWFLLKPPVKAAAGQ